MNLIKSSGAALGAAILALGPSDTPRAYCLAAISLGRDHEVGIVEPYEQECVPAPAPSPAENDDSRCAERPEQSTAD